MVDFAALPPEVNSGRMYTGAGSAPMTAAAAAWDRLTAQLTSAADSYQTVLTTLTDQSWQGPAATAMTTAAAPYLTWLQSTATQTEHTANQARAAAAAYQQAFAATVPPSTIAANRAALATLTATNTLGQNSAAIAANHADYAEMWAQDAAAMHDYAANSAAATTLTPFTTPPQTTNPTENTPANTLAQTAASSTQGLGNLLQSNPLEQLLNSPFIQGIEQLGQKFSGFSDFAGAQGLGVAGILLGGPDWAVQGAVAATQVFAAVTAGTPGLASAVAADAPGFTLAGSSGSGLTGTAALAEARVSADLGRAASLGSLSVPPSWGAAPEDVRLAARALPAAGLAGLPEAGAAGPGGWLGGIPPMGSVVNAPRSGESRARSASGTSASQHLGGAIAADEATRGQPVFAPGVRGASSERDELNRVREAVAELRQTREALKRSAVEMIREARRR